MAAAEAVTLAAKAREKMWQEKERLVEARGEAEAKLSQLLENIGKGKNKLHGVRDVLRKESKDAPATGGTALTTIIGACFLCSLVVGVGVGAWGSGAHYDRRWAFSLCCICWGLVVWVGFRREGGGGA